MEAKMSNFNLYLNEAIKVQFLTDLTDIQRSEIRKKGGEYLKELIQEELDIINANKKEVEE